MRIKTHICLVLSLVMVMALIPASVFAADDYAATIDGKRYTTISKAINAVGDGQTIKLLKDSIAGEADDERAIRINKPDTSFTIDMNGHKIEHYYGVFKIVACDAITIKNGTAVGEYCDVPTFDVTAGILRLEDINGSHSCEGSYGNVIKAAGGDVIIKSGNFSVSDNQDTVIEENSRAVVLDPRSSANVSTWETAEAFTVTYAPEASIGSKDYATISRAVNAVGDGQTIKLLKDSIDGEADNGEAISINKPDASFTIDMNGHKIEHYYGVFKIVACDAITIKNGTAVGEYCDVPTFDVTAGILRLEDINGSHSCEGSYGNVIKAAGGDVIIKSGNFSVSDNQDTVIDVDSGTIVLDPLTYAPASWQTDKAFTAEYRPVTKVSIGGTSTVAAGSAVKLTAAVTPTNAVKKTVAWKSSSAVIAKVDSTGSVTGVKPGKAIITVTATDRSMIKASKTIYVVPKKAAISKVTSPKKAQLKVAWKKDAQATGYEVWAAKNSKFTTGKKTALITKNSTVNKTFTKLSAGKTYYAKVRAYKTIDGKKYYGAWSTAKKLKVKAK